MKTEQIIELIKQLEKEKLSFNEKWKKQAPIRTWSEILFRQACDAKGLLTLDQIIRFVMDNDHRCSQVNPAISGIIRDDEEFKIVTWLDYDVECIWAKFAITHKPSNTHFRNAVGVKDTLNY